MVPMTSSERSHQQLLGLRMAKISCLVDDDRNFPQTLQPNPHFQETRKPDDGAFVGEKILSEVERHGASSGDRIWNGT